jgi:hypothetical protein
MRRIQRSSRIAKFLKLKKLSQQLELESYRRDTELDFGSASSFPFPYFLPPEMFKLLQSSYLFWHSSW